MPFFDHENAGFGCYNIGFGSRTDVGDSDKVYYSVIIGEGRDKFALRDFTMTTAYRFKSLLDATVAAMYVGGEVWKTEVNGDWYHCDNYTHTLLANYKHQRDWRKTWATKPTTSCLES